MPRARAGRGRGRRCGRASMRIALVPIAGSGGGQRLSAACLEAARRSEDPRRASRSVRRRRWRAALLYPPPRGQVRGASHAAWHAHRAADGGARAGRATAPRVLHLHRRRQRTAATAASCRRLLPPPRRAATRAAAATAAAAAADAAACGVGGCCHRADRARARAARLVRLPLHRRARAAGRCPAEALRARWRRVVAHARAAAAFRMAGGWAVSLWPQAGGEPPLHAEVAARRRRDGGVLRAARGGAVRCAHVLAPGGQHVAASPSTLFVLLGRSSRAAAPRPRNARRPRAAGSGGGGGGSGGDGGDGGDGGGGGGCWRRYRRSCRSWRRSRYS